MNYSPGRAVRSALTAPAKLYDWHAGFLLGHRFLRLTHLGRRTGRRFNTVLEVIGRRPDGELTVISGFGRTADWYLNIQANPPVELAVGGRRFTPEFRILEPAEATATLAAYERAHRFIDPIVRRVLSKLLGWRYAGTAADRERLARELPMVAFRPATRDAPSRRHGHDQRRT